MPRGVLPEGTWFWTAAFLVAVFLPLLYGGTHFLNVCVLFGMWASINLMWTLVLGVAGIYSFATLAIVGACAYLATFLSINEGWSWPATLTIATAAGAFLGLVVAAPAIRLRGVYFALLTFGLVELFRSYASVSEDLGQFEGLYGAASFIPAGLFGTNDGALVGYYAALALVAIALVVYVTVDRGRLGLLLRTARESEQFARAVGIDVVRARMAVFLISSAMLGFIGGFYASFYRGVSPSIFSFDLLLLLFAMIVVGGLGSARGVLLGTALLLFIDQRFLESGPSRFIAAGALMFLVTLFTRSGLAGIPAQLRDWVKAGELEPGPAALASPPRAGGEALQPERADDVAGRERAGRKTAPRSLS